ncbi:hypothetical protein BO82DRAFT_406579 [Aspergillus uvarum CBS 121591]|uniref:CENP-V/GFA domain-containing protein n=1 Tax=Aspergillus uvarum CBS 121591 TaxID=1448315 RepID=A0A319CNC4_9EURO|nr:hypothetical protein BO82DRAFT_406579 [Aspergillus uvarum CBS 121591]PYH76968.1 hypothetical protein BO82DRAFT_406579 [Aspergillus uvarum CBS 121591]
MEGEVYRGSCLCKAVSFSVRGSPEKVFICYCQDCVKNSGAPYQLCAKFHRSQLHFEANRDENIGTWVVTKTSSGAEKHKKFCAKCGCTLWTIPMNHGGEHLIVRAALVDHGLETFSPQAEFFAGLRPSWVKSPDNVKSFATMPGR